MGLTLRRHGAALALATFFARQCGRAKQCGGLAANRCVLEPHRYRGHCRRIDKRDHRRKTSSALRRSPCRIFWRSRSASRSCTSPAARTAMDDMVDLRGFGAFAQSNVLVLVNGRRYQDFDLQGFDFSQIPLNSIERIEITRGMSGTVLYGDGAIGGVINIVTKTASGAPFSGRVEGAVGSYGFGEGRVSASATSGPWSTAIYANAATSSRLSPEQPAEPAKCRRQFELPRPRVDRLSQHYRRFPAPESSRRSAKSAAGLSDYA